MCIQIIIFFFGLRIKMGIIKLSISIYDNNFFFKKRRKGKNEFLVFTFQTNENPKNAGLIQHLYQMTSL